MQLPPAPPTGDGMYIVPPPLPLGLPPNIVPPPNQIIPPPLIGAPPPNDPTLKNVQSVMANMMNLLVRLTKPEKHIQSADVDTTIPPNRTLYINNLNDKIKPDIIKEELHDMCKPFGEIVQIIAMKSYWRRGQAFVAFRDQAAADRALMSLLGRMLHGKPMRVNYARDEGDCFKKEAGTFQPKPKGPKKPRAIREREEALKEQFEALQRQMMTFQQQPFGLTKSETDLVEAESADDGAKRKAFSMSLTGPHESADAKKRKIEGGGGVPAPPPGPMNVSAPNKILFLENLPTDCTQAELEEMFKNREGFEKVRYITARKLAFVDFKSIGTAAAALEGITDVEVRPGKRLQASFAKR